MSTQFKHYAKELLNIALPIIMGNLGFFLIGAGDVLIAGHHSTDTLAAISIATAITNCIQTFGIGLISSVSPLLSNFRGEKKSAKKYFYPTLRFAMLLSVIVMFAVLAFIPVIDYLKFDPKLVPMIKQYMFVTAFATFGAYLHAALNEFLQAFEVVVFPNLVTAIAVFLNIAVSISAACLTYTVCLHLAEMLFHIPSFHEAGYICSMLFIIPGFPFITSGIDLAKLDLRSGLERLTYSVIIVLVATMFAWIMALLLKLQPQDFSSLSIDPVLHLLLRLITSFCGVFGFSIMFNSSIPMAATAAFIGAIANTLRLELVNFTATPAAVAAFIGALTAGLLASIIKKWNGYPRISLTVPSIVIMVPGLYLYRAIYNFGIMSLTEAVSWFAAAIMIIIALPLGLIFARILTDRTFRYCT